MGKLFANAFNLDTLPNPIRSSKPIDEYRYGAPMYAGRRSVLETLGKVSLVHPQKINTDRTLYRQGVVEAAYKAKLSSYITVNKDFAKELNINQGSVVIKRNVRSVEQGIILSQAEQQVSIIKVTKPKKEINQGSVEISTKKISVAAKQSPVDVDSVLDWAGRFKKSFIVDPKLDIKPIVSGDRTFDPKIEVKLTSEESFINNPNIDPELPKEVVLVDPNTTVIPTTGGDAVINPNTQVKKTTPDELITIPKTNYSKGGDITGNIVIPKTNYNNGIIEDEFITIPNKSFPLFNNLNANLQGPDIKSILVKPIKNPKERHGATSNINLFPQTDNKIASALTPQFHLFGPGVTFPSNSPTPTPWLNVNYYPWSIVPSNQPSSQILTGVLHNPGSIFPDSQPSPQLLRGVKHDPGSAFPSDNIEPLFCDIPSNEYSSDRRYNSETKGGDNSDLKQAGNANTFKNIPIDGKWMATHNQPTDPGGYTALSYTQIQRKAGNKQEAKKDFTVELGLNKNPIEDWETRLGMPNKGVDAINRSVNSTHADFVKVLIVSARDNISLQFRSFITAFSDNFAPLMTDVNYIGRPDTMKVYKGVQRTISLAFKVPVMHSKEVSVIYQKLEQLIKIGTMGKVSAYGISTNSYLDAPFLKLTIGGWLKNTPIILTGLKFDTNPTEYSWDIQKEVPQIIDISLEAFVLSDNTGKGMLSSGNYIAAGK